MAKILSFISPKKKIHYLFQSEINLKIYQNYSLNYFDFITYKMQKDT